MSNRIITPTTSLTFRKPSAQFRDFSACHKITKGVTKMRKRGRPPIHRKAMTAAQRQARRREKLRRIAREEAAKASERQAYRPPHGYGNAKQTLIDKGHCFVRAKREYGFEEGVFVDGAYLGSQEVIELAEISQRKDRDAWLAKRRIETKADACGAVQGYMNDLQVTLKELANPTPIGKRIDR
jgi:hypothetical protein